MPRYSRWITGVVLSVSGGLLFFLTFQSLLPITTVFVASRLIAGAQYVFSIIRSVAALRSSPIAPNLGDEHTRISTPTGWTIVVSAYLPNME